MSKQKLIHFASGLSEMTSPEVVNYLVMTHHQFTRDVMAEIQDIMDTVSVSVDKGAQALKELKEIFADFRLEMENHLDSEEQILFPALAENSESANALPEAIKKMLKEHDHHDVELNQIRKLNETLLAAAGNNPAVYQLCYKIRLLDTDLHQHMQVETELLFPRMLDT